MKNILSILCFIIQFNSEAQIISTIAGTGMHSNTGDGGPASVATLSFPARSTFDKNGNYYFATGYAGCSIRKITPSGIISTVAGGTSGFNGDGGPATDAAMKDPQGLAVDTLGNLYIVDEGNENVRKVNISTGIISTIAGTGAGGYSGDGGPATNATFWGAQDICLDKSGNIYIADYQNNRIRKINTSGIITTVVGGNGGGHYYGDGGLADTSEIKAPTGICIDHIGNLYIAENSGCRVRKVNTSGIISTIVGNGTPGYTGDGGLGINAQSIPLCICVDKFGNVYILEEFTSVIRMLNVSGIISTVAGTGIDGFSGDGGYADSAEIYTRTGGGISTDTCGNLYIGDLNNYRIRKVTYPHCNYLEVENNNLAKINTTIYPNPTYDQVNIVNVKTPSTYHLLNIVGATIQHGTLKENNNSISIRAIPDGMYILEIIDEQKNRTINKIIKQ